MPKNPHDMTVSSFQNKFLMNLWRGILANKLVGPFAFEGPLTGRKYVVFLQNELP